MKPRKLTLRKETLVALTTDELQNVVGAGTLLQCLDLTDYCIPTQGCTGYYPSLNAPCTD